MAVAVGARLLRHRDDLGGDQQARHGPFGLFPFRASPRQADVLIVAGTCTTKMAGPLIRLWDQMPEPKWCIALGDCTCSGGRYKRSYSTIEGIDRIMPVDIYIPGCPPRPEGLIFGFLKLQQLIKDRRGHWPDRAIGPNVPDLASESEGSIVADVDTARSKEIDVSTSTGHITIREADTIWREEGGWFDARWHFSFDRYRDPEQMGVGALRVFNDDRIVAGAEWPLHPHQDIESLTYVVEGQLPPCRFPG